MGENFGWLELTLGAVTGAFTMLLLSLAVGVISARRRKNKDKQKELIGKAVAHMMGKVNELFIAYRLGDLAFEQMERESREYISKITDDINENNSDLSSAYVAVVTRYIEEKTEMLIAIKEDFRTGHSHVDTVGSLHVHPTTHDAKPVVDPVMAAMTEAPVPQAAPQMEAPAPVAETPVQQVATAPVAPAAPVIEPPVQAPVEEPQVTQPVFEPQVNDVQESVEEDSFEVEIAAEEPVVEAPVESNPFSEPAVDTFAQPEMVEETAAPVEEIQIDEPVVAETPQVEEKENFLDISFDDPSAEAQDDLSASISESVESLEMVQPTAESSRFNELVSDLNLDAAREPIQDNAPKNEFSAFDLTDGADSVESVQPAASASNDGLSIGNDEFSSAIDNAFDLGGASMQQTQQAAPGFAAQSQPMVQQPQANSGFAASNASMGQAQANPFQQAQQSPVDTGMPSNDPFNSETASKFSLNGDGNLDVEATQEFNLNDIMSQAQEYDNNSNQGGDDGMVSGDDVASKLDSFFG